VKADSLLSEQPVWRWASLINRAEQYLLQAVNSGHTVVQAETALSVAVSRWKDMQEKSSLPPQSEPQAVQNSGRSLRFVGSHDLLVESLIRLLSEHDSKIHLSTEYTGSLGGLMALAQRNADVVGTHLWDESTDSYNLPFVRRLLPGRQLVLITLADRSLGLILPAGNPDGIADLGDLARPESRLANRQPGSGTRVWLDARLKTLGIEPESVPNYAQEELTHLAVARAVAEGRATVGLGIHAAAAAYGLAFVPLTQERYELVIPGESWSLLAIQALVETVRSSTLKKSIATLGGYDSSRTGSERWVS
jgi:putative molybdopterin biosynthesis protein